MTILIIIIAIISIPYLMYILNIPKRDEKREDIYTKCKNMHLIKYTINDDYSVDVDGNVYLSYKDLFFQRDLMQELTKLPLKFRNIKGSVYIGDENKLESFENFPDNIEGKLYGKVPYLKDFENLPEYVVKKNIKDNFIFDIKKVKKFLKIKKIDDNAVDGIVLNILSDCCIYNIIDCNHNYNIKNNLLEINIDANVVCFDHNYNYEYIKRIEARDEKLNKLLYE